MTTTNLMMERAAAYMEAHDVDQETFIQKALEATQGLLPHHVRPTRPNPFWTLLVSSGYF